MSGLHIVKAGKARWIGASSMYARQFATMLHTPEANGSTRFSTMQDHVDLLGREDKELSRLEAPHVPHAVVGFA
jgi:aryl-alcohol dehydrogenase-like predicted oxidoreductase